MMIQDKIKIAKELLNIARLIIGNMYDCLHVGYNDTINIVNQNFQVYFIESQTMLT